MNARSLALFLGVAACFCTTETLAGMPAPPSVELTKIAALRIDVISFCLAVVLSSAWGIQRLWNALAGDFSRLRRLSYRQSLALTTLWGLLFVLVLTMIGGARELMTPGAWKQDGWTYKLDGPSAVSPDGEVGAQVASPASERRNRLKSLRTALWSYAESHDGAFPTFDAKTASSQERPIWQLPIEELVPEIDPSLWIIPDSSQLRYVYTPGLKAGEGDAPLVYEPGIFGEERLTLLTSGEIKPLRLDEIVDLVEQAQP